MNKKIIILYILGMSFQESFLDASAQASGQNFIQGIKSFGNSIGDMFKGMGGMFGAVPAGYQCSWEVINDTDQEIDIYYKNFLSVMGGFFPATTDTVNDVSSNSLHAIQPYQATFAYVLATPATLAAPMLAGTTPPPVAPPTSGFYSGVKYYFALFMGYSSAGSSSHGSTKGTNFYQEWQLNLGQKDDNSVSYYHVYTGKRFVGGNITHMSMVEIAGGYQPDLTKPNAASNIAFNSNLGQIDPNATASSLPAGSVFFYNTTSQPVQLTITLSDGITKYIDIALEPFSYNVLSCLPTQTINGSKLAFGGTLPFKTITVPAITVQGSNYIFEIYQDVGQTSPKVAIQGFNPGNYDICVSTNMRDISPQQAILWIQSAAQQTPAAVSAAPASEAYDLPGQVWMVYQSPSVKKTQKVVLGVPTTLNFIRPSLADQIGYIYFIYVNTQTDAQATAFINNFLNGKCGAAIKQQAVSTINTSIDIAKVEKASADQKITGTIVDQVNSFSSGNAKGAETVSTQTSSPMALSNQLAQQVLSGSVPANSAQLQDSLTGLTGYVLGVDVFTSFGGELPPISYYQLNPAIINITILATVLTQCLKDQQTPTPSVAVMSSQISTWLNDYIIKGSQVVQAEVAAFLNQYGSANLFDSKGALTKGGQMRITNFVNGPISLANPPILYSPIAIQSPAYTPPTGMPGASQSSTAAITSASS